MSSFETTPVHTDITISQSKDLQRVMEGTLLKMERFGLLGEAAADHIRIVVAEGIAEKFGEKYRSYPSAPRLDSVGIRRDIPITSCVLATLKDFTQQQSGQTGEKKNKRVNNKQNHQSRTTSSREQSVRQGQKEFKQAVTQQNQQRSPQKIAEPSPTTKRVSDWVEDVAEADLPPVSFPPEKASSITSLDKATSSFSLALVSSSVSFERSVGNESRLAANASHWEAILNNPIQIASQATREAYSKTSFKGSSVSPDKCSDSVATENSADRKTPALVQGSVATKKIISGSNTKTTVATKKTSLNHVQTCVEDGFAVTDMDLSSAIKEGIVPAKALVIKQVPLKHTPVVVANHTPFVRMQDTDFDAIFSAASRPRTPAPSEDAEVNTGKLIDFSP